MVTKLRKSSGLTDFCENFFRDNDGRIRHEANVIADVNVDVQSVSVVQDPVSTSPLRDNQFPVVDLGVGVTFGRHEDHGPARLDDLSRYQYCKTLISVTDGIVNYGMHRYIKLGQMKIRSKASSQRK